MNTDRLVSCISSPVYLYVLFMGLLLPQLLAGQTVYRTAPENAGTLTVTGTSDLQAWAVASEALQSQGLFVFTPENQLSGISGLTFSLPTKSLMGTLKPMNIKAQKALQAKKHPTISFTLHQAQVEQTQLRQSRIKATGSLTIKGVTQTVSLTLLAVTNPNNSVTLTGTKALKFSDFLIKKPRFMGGVMQAGNDVTVDISLTFAPAPAVVLDTTH